VPESAIPDYYIATSPDFDTVRGAKGAWNALESAENLWISMLVLEKIDEDVKMKKLLEEGLESGKEYDNDAETPLKKIDIRTILSSEGLSLNTTFVVVRRRRRSWWSILTGRRRARKIAARLECRNLSS
jgi:hypothetical protein